VRGKLSRQRSACEQPGDAVIDSCVDQGIRGSGVPDGDGFAAQCGGNRLKRIRV
jgi:hypothetical protein